MAPGTRITKRKSTGATSQRSKRARVDVPVPEPMQQAGPSSLTTPLDEDAVASRIANKAMAMLDAKLQDRADALPQQSEVPSTSQAQVHDIFELEDQSHPDAVNMHLDSLLADQGSRSTQAGSPTQQLSNACARLPPSLEVISTTLLQAALSSSTHASAEPARPITTQTPPPDLMIGAIVGGVLGGVFLLAIFILLLCWCRKRWQRKREPLTDSISQSETSSHRFNLPGPSWLHWQGSDSMTQATRFVPETYEKSQLEQISKAVERTPGIDWSILQRFSEAQKEETEPTGKISRIHRATPPYRRKGDFFWLPASDTPQARTLASTWLPSQQTLDTDDDDDSNNRVFRWTESGSES